MRILVDASVLQQDITGVARVLLGLYKACLHIRPALNVAGIHRKPLLCQLPDGMQDSLFASRTPKRWWRRVAIPGYCALKQPDIVHFPWNDGILPLPRNCLPVLTLHDIIPLALPDLYFASGDEEERYRRHVQSNLDRARLAFTDSECSKNDILRFMKPHSEPIVIYPAAMLAELPMPQVRLPRGLDKYFLYYGGYEKRKGLGTLVRVYHKLFRERAVDCPLVILGKQNYFSEEFRNDIEKAAATGAVVEKGYVGDGELVQWLLSAQALVYPSMYEGFGYPPLEAMTVGCPVITTRASSIPEVCGDAAIYAKSGDDDALANAITEMSRNEGLRETYSALGSRQAAKFNWEQSADTFLKALDNLLSGAT